MLKYLNTQVVFQEFPGETTFAINLTNCPNHCKGCHSPQLWEDTGTELTQKELIRLVEPVLSGITCIGFMGGDGNIPELLKLARFCKANYPDIKIGWYSGRANWNSTIMEPFDYCKFGPYMVDRGGLDNPNTNQVFLKRVDNEEWKDITKKFQKSC